jgi:glucose/mannose-6-phosphate isomerase
MDEMVVVWMRDREDHPRVKMRFEIAGGIIEGFAGKVVNVRSEGKSLLARTFSLVHLGDWVSFYLAMLGRVDPTPVKVIDFLKTRLAGK